jgi:hypothetical protein
LGEILLKEKGFTTRLTVSDMREKVKQARLADIHILAVQYYEKAIEQKCEELANVLVNERGLDVDSFEIHAETALEGDCLVVSLNVVTLEQTLRFPLLGGDN